MDDCNNIFKSLKVSSVTRANFGSGVDWKSLKWPCHIFGCVWSEITRSWFTIPTYIAPLLRSNLGLKWLNFLHVRCVFFERAVRGCIQKFPDGVDNDIINNNKHSLRSNTKGYGSKITRLTHKIAIQLELVTESCTICSSRSTRPVRKLLDDTPS